MVLAGHLNIKCTIAYRGTRYLGWQKTQGGPSIEECLEKALKQLLQHPIVLQAASRTDRGVHAEAQVVNFFTTSESVGRLGSLQKLEKALRATLPPDISLIQLKEVEGSFHPTLDCIAKEYHYHICNSSFQLPFYRAVSWHVRTPLDMDVMQKAAAYLVGYQNYSSFSNKKISNEEEAHKRVMRISIYPLFEKRLRIELEGESFLYKMARNLVGTLVYMGCGKMALEDLPLIFAARDRRLAGITAPAHGLTLKKISYSNASFGLTKNSSYL